MRKTLRYLTLSMAIAGVGTSNALWNYSHVQAQEKGAVDKVDAKKVIERGVAFLKSSQAADGSLSSSVGPGITGLGVAALLAVGTPLEDSAVQKGLEYLLATKQADGGFYAPKSRHANYETCIALFALSRANKDGKFDTLIANAQKFVKEQQWDEGEGLTSKDLGYGGAGYGSKSRPDLSNTSFFVEALRDSGAKEDDPAIQKALDFISRCQNLESPKNDTPFAGLVNDGGFYYTSANGGDSMAGKDEKGGLRSYGSMTYAGLKSMIYAGVSADDFRVKAAKAYLKKNYTVTTNPGMGTSGLYYYRHTMAKALSVLGSDTFEAEDGSHAWKAELLAEIAKAQKENGSWTNTDARFMEGDANLTTAYVLLTLSYLK